MLKKAMAAGYPEVTARSISKWSEQGLLAQPRRVGQGRGTGVRFLRPDTQADLLIEILRRRRAGEAIATICTVPVSTWLFHEGDIIELPQLRRALTTWWGRAGRPTWDQSDELARQVIAQHLPGHLSRRRRYDLKEMIAGIIETGDLDMEALVAGVVACREEQIARGLSAPEIDRLSRGLTKSWSMVIAMERFPSLTDDRFDLARSRVKFQILDYCLDFEKLSASHGDLMTDFPTYEYFANQACQMLVSEIGMELDSEDRGEAVGPAESLPPLVEIPLFRSLPIRIEK